jgi:hypothetical protein
MATPKDVPALLAKIRKGSTAAFGPADYEAALAALPGWKTETLKGTGKESRTVLGFVVTTPDGKVAKVMKEPRYRHLVFYTGLTLDGVEAHGYLSKVLTEKTSLLKDIDAVIGPVVKKVKFGREAARTCPVCMRDIMLNDDGTMVHHGYHRPGWGYIVGDCFAVNYQPWEVSPKGMIDYVKGILIPHQTYKMQTLRELKAGEIKVFHKTETDYSAPRVNGHRQTKTIEVTEASDAYEFRRMLESAIRATEGDIKQVTKDIEARQTLIAEWKAA